MWCGVVLNWTWIELELDFWRKLTRSVWNVNVSVNVCVNVSVNVNVCVMWIELHTSNFIAANVKFMTQLFKNIFQIAYTNAFEFVF